MPITPATLTLQYTNQFTANLRQEVRSHRWDLPNTIVADLTAIATALLVPDTTTHDTTIQAAPIALRPGLVPGPATGRNKFVNDVLNFVNQGKNYGQAYFTNAQMAAIINGALASVLPPTSATAPTVTGSVAIGSTLTTTNGTWNFTPTSFTYQWLRAGAFIAGATAITYVTTNADHLLAVSCRVTASNAAGSGSATSNSISVA